MAVERPRGRERPRGDRFYNGDAPLYDWAKTKQPLIMMRNLRWIEGQPALGTPAERGGLRTPSRILGPNG